MTESRFTGKCQPSEQPSVESFSDPTRVHLFLCLSICGYLISFNWMLFFGTHGVNSKIVSTLAMIYSFGFFCRSGKHVANTYLWYPLL